MYEEADEMRDVEIKLRFGKLIDEAIAAFAVDPSYSADITKKAKLILARREKKNS